MPFCNPGYRQIASLTVNGFLKKINAKIKLAVIIVKRICGQFGIKFYEKDQFEGEKHGWRKKEDFVLLLF